MDKNKYDRIYTHILTDKEAIECMGEKLTALTLQLTAEKHRADKLEKALEEAYTEIKLSKSYLGWAKYYTQQAEALLKEKK